MKNKLILAGVFLLSLAASMLFISEFWKERALSRKIQTIPSEDRIDLEAFFRILTLQEGGAYVLFGDKPMAFTAYFDSCRFNICFSRTWRYYSENQIIKNGWKIWEKYRHLFPSDHFILECRSFDDGRAEICLINASKFKKTIDINLKDFQMIYGPNINSESLLNKYKKGNIALFKLLKEHHAAFGILLGFGTRNSWLFHEYATQNGTDPNELYKVPSKISMGSESLENTFFKGAFKEINHRKNFKFLYLPYFLADIRSKETHALRHQYLIQQQEIQDKYAKGHFLEVTLKRFSLNI